MNFSVIAASMALTNMNKSNRLALCPLGLIFPWEITKKIK